MRRQRSGPAYTIAFSAAVCVVCAVLVSTAAVLLRERQAANAELDRQRNVLHAAGLAREGERLGADEVRRRFASFDAVSVDLPGGPGAGGAPGGVRRVTVYLTRDEGGRIALVVLPIEGRGLWSTMYGFVALGPDLRTVRGLAFYRHGETPGLGGEVDNARWKARWPGRAVFDETGRVALHVTRGAAGSPADDPYRVDGLSGATITGRAVTDMLQVWFGRDAFGPYLDGLRREGRHAEDP